MKTLIFSIIACLSFTAVDAQTNNDLEKAIQSCLDSLVKDHIEFFERITEKPEKYPFYISTENFPPNFEFRDEIQGLTIEYFNMANPRAYKKKFNGMTRILVLTRLRIDKNKIKINFAEYFPQIKIRVKYWDSDISYFVCEYSCEKQEWGLVQTKFLRI